MPGPVELYERNRATAVRMLRLRQAATDVVIQEGRYFERDGSVSKVLAVIPKAALDDLRDALRESQP
jgi:hypothetical protein